MLLVSTSKIDSVAQLLTVILLFVVVLGATWLTTRYVTGVQKGKMKGSNFEVIDTFRLTQNKYVQILRIGKKYMAVAICKDTVTVLRELDESEIVFHDSDLSMKAVSFEDIFNKAKDFTDNKTKKSIEESDEDDITKDS